MGQQQRAARDGQQPVGKQTSGSRADGHKHTALPECWVSATIHHTACQNVARRQRPPLRSILHYMALHRPLASFQILTPSVGFLLWSLLNRHQNLWNAPVGMNGYLDPKPPYLGVRGIRSCAQQINQYPGHRVPKLGLVGSPESKQATTPIRFSTPALALSAVHNQRPSAQGL